MYKSKLQELCYGKQWGLPRYTAMKDGPDHNPCFKASVSVNGFSFDAPTACKSSKQAQNLAAMLAFLHFTSPQSSSSSSGPNVENRYKYLIQSDDASVKDVQFEDTLIADEHTLESPDFFGAVKGAEHAATKSISISLSYDGSQINDESSQYKNRLQELAQREDFSLPAYKTVKSGASHMPTFSSTVEVEGEKFCGRVGKTKKQAELDAAKVAYIALIERRLGRTTELTSPQYLIESALKTTQSSDLGITVNYEECTKDIKELQMDNMNETGKSSPCSDSELSSTEESPPSPSRIQPNLSLVSIISDRNEGESSAGVRSYLLCNRVRVYTQFPDIAFPSCITVLPIGDDKWVAFSLEFPNEESN